MTNIWLKRRKTKRFTFEIAKNAIFRIGPIDVTIVENNPRTHHVKMNLGDTANIDIVELTNIVKDISRTDRSYYGRIRTFRNNKETKILKMEALTKLEIEFEKTNLILVAYYI